MNPQGPPVEIFFDPHVSVAMAALGFALVVLILLLVWNSAERKR